MLDNHLSTSINDADIVVFYDLSQGWIYPECLINDKTKKPYSTIIAGEKTSRLSCLGKNLSLINRRS